VQDMDEDNKRKYNMKSLVQNKAKH